MTFFGMVIKSFLRRSKEIIRICLATILAVCMVMLVLIVEENIYRWQLANNKEKFGDWFVVDYGYEEREMFSEHPYLEDARTAYITAYIFDDSWLGYGTGIKHSSDISAGYMPPEFLEGNIHLEEGKMPEKDNEIALDWNTMLDLGQMYEVGDTITLNYYENNKFNFTDKRVTKEYIVSGILRNYTNTWVNASWFPRIIMTKNESDRIKENKSEVYIYRLKDYVKSDDYREIYTGMIGDRPGNFFNEYVYDVQPWGPKHVYRYLYTLILIIGISAITYQMTVYNKGREETYYKLRRLGATRLQIGAIKFVESAVIILISGVIGIIISVSVSRKVFHIIELQKELKFFYIGDNIIQKTVVSVLIILVAQFVLTNISILLSKVKIGTKENRDKDAKKEMRIAGNVGLTIHNRFVKSNGIVMNIGLRVLSVLMTLVILGCSFNIYNAYKEYRINDNSADYLAFRQREEANFELYDLSEYYMELSMNSYGHKIFHIRGEATFFADGKYPNFTKDKYIEYYMYQSRQEEWPTESYYDWRMSNVSIVNSGYCKTANTSIYNGIPQYFIDTVRELEGVDSVEFSTVESNRLWSWDGMDEDKLDIGMLTTRKSVSSSPMHMDKYLFSTDYIEPTKELYDRLSKYIEPEYRDYEAFRTGKQVVVFTRDHVGNKKDTSMLPGIDINYHYTTIPYYCYTMDINKNLYPFDSRSALYSITYEYLFSKLSGNIGIKYTEEGYYSFDDSFVNASDYNSLGMPYGLKDENYDTLMKFEEMMGSKNYELLFTPAQTVTVAAVVDYDDVKTEFADILADCGYYTAVASVNLASELIDKQNEMVEKYYEIKLPEDEKYKLSYNQIAVKYTLSSPYLATHNVLQSLCKTENMVGLSNTVEKLHYREKCLNALMQYGITIIAVIFVYVCIMSILLRNRLEQRIDRLIILRRLGMTRRKMTWILLLENVRESLWCVFILPIQFVISGIIISKRLKSL